MLARGYRLVLELIREDGARLGQVAVTPDWEPAREWTRFLGIRRGLLPLSMPERSSNIEPLWRRDTGEPYMRGFRVTIPGNDSMVATEDFPTTYFRSLARRACGHFVEDGALKDGDRVQFLVAAYPERERSCDGGAAGFDHQEVEPVIHYSASPLAESMAGAVPEGTVEAGDMPVFVPRQILDEAEAATIASRGTECGGILIGHLVHDETLPEVFAEITAQIPARGNAEAAKLTFSPETWTAVRTAVNIRNKGEIYLGFWHSHPVREWCRNTCSPEKLAGCPLARGFFSEEDQSMFRTVFPRAYSLALVCSDLPIGGPAFSMFGWSHGTIQQRGYYVRVSERPAARKPGTSAAAGGEVRRTLCATQPWTDTSIR